MPKPRPKDEGFWFESIGTRAGQPWGWQEWGLCASFAMIGVAAVLLTPERSSIGFFAILASATTLLVVIGARRRNEGQRRPEQRKRGRPPKAGDER